MARNIDKYNLYDHILLNEGAYFFKRGNASISKVSIEELFSSVAKEQVVLARKVRVRETVHEKSVFCSLLVVKMSAIPRFLNEADLPTSTKKAVMETKLGYLLIVEDDDYIVIVKKNVSHLSSFLKDSRSDRWRCLVWHIGQRHYRVSEDELDQYEYK